MRNQCANQASAGCAAPRPPRSSSQSRQGQDGQTNAPWCTNSSPTSSSGERSGTSGLSHEGRPARTDTTPRTSVLSSEVTSCTSCCSEETRGVGAGVSQAHPHPSYSCCTLGLYLHPRLLSCSAAGYQKDCVPAAVLCPHLAGRQVRHNVGGVDDAEPLVEQRFHKSGVGGIAHARLAHGVQPDGGPAHGNEVWWQPDRPVRVRNLHTAGRLNCALGWRSHACAGTRSPGVCDAQLLLHVSGSIHCSQHRHGTAS